MHRRVSIPTEPAWLAAGRIRSLPHVIEAEHDEVFALIESKKLHGRGLGWVDVHLLASAMLGHTRLWTLDKRLAEQARKLDVQFVPAT